MLVSRLMAAPDGHDITRLLLAWSEGDDDALGKLAPLVEAELQRLGRHYLRGERPGHTLQPTALVNEAYLRLLDWRNLSWQNRAHFMGVAANMMRRILVDHARRYRFLKRGGEMVKVSLDARQLGSSGSDSARAEAGDRISRKGRNDSQRAQRQFFFAPFANRCDLCVKLSSPLRGAEP